LPRRRAPHSGAGQERRRTTPRLDRPALVDPRRVGLAHLVDQRVRRDRSFGSADVRALSVSGDALGGVATTSPSRTTLSCLARATPALAVRGCLPRAENRRIRRRLTRNCPSKTVHRYSAASAGRMASPAVDDPRRMTKQHGVFGDESATPPGRSFVKSAAVGNSRSVLRDLAFKDRW
jgi:hypothetical protein